MKIYRFDKSHIDLSKLTEVTDVVHLSAIKGKITLYFSGDHSITLVGEYHKVQGIWGDLIDAWKSEYCPRPPPRPYGGS